MPFTSESNLKIYYEIHGEEGAYPVLLIIGWGGNLKLWKYQIDDLSKKFNVVSFDNRGTGKSEGSDQEYSMKDLACDAIVLLDELGIEETHVIGESMGGMIAQELALNYPSRVNKLVLSCTFPKPGENEIKGIKLLESAGSGSISTEDVNTNYIRIVLSTMFSREYIKKQGEALVKDFGGAIQPLVPFDEMARQGRAIIGFDALDRLNKLRCPTLILSGTEDSITLPHNSEKMAQIIPNSRLERFEGAGHLIPWERKDEFNKLVMDFLQDTHSFQETALRIHL